MTVLKTPTRRIGHRNVTWEQIQYSIYQNICLSFFFEKSDTTESKKG